ncbi:SymE family type I addiction module toxin [Tahibacter amnicola]|uniref:SymE family type I addiction module toxin n=1 Tax=Tahibacter amnicola TaxID=2976241 RepID=UPI003CCD0504
MDTLDGTPQLQNADRSRSGRTVPTIRLRGHWLVEAGFAPTDKVHIRISRGRLIMTRA